MRKFATNLFICSFLVTFVLAALFLRYRSVENSLLERDLDLHGGTYAIVASDSHAQCALLPQAWEGLGNFSAAGSPLWLSDYKSRKLVRDNPGRIKVVLFVMGVHKVTEFDRVYRKMNTHRLRFLPFYCYDPDYLCDRLGYSHIEVIYELLATSRFLSAVRGQVDESVVVDPVSERTDSIFQSEAVADSILKHTHFTPSGEWFSLDPIREDIIPTLDGIRLIVDLAAYVRNRGAAFFLVTTPCHPQYVSSIPPGWMRVYRSCMEYLQKQGVDHLNYLDEEFEEGDFIDADHLNRVGAMKMTARIQKDIETRLR